MKYIINTRQDLDNIEGTSEHTEFMNLLKGSMTRKQDIQIYPDNYGEPDYTGETLETIWTDVEDLSTIERFEFTKGDFA
tara:strand:+ start:999 stop:1235 length:237 start_codon:yes stop_codon:yes gene_type:complete